MSRRHWREAKPVVLDTRVVTSTGGGPEKTILNQPRFLDDLGFRNVVAYMHPPGDEGFAQIQAKAAQKQATLFSVPDRGALDPGVVSRMLGLCKKERVAIWHGHDYKSNALGLLIRALWPMKLVSTVHGWGKLGPRTRLYYGIDRFCLRFYDSVICVSDDLQAGCLAAGVPESRCQLIENAIDTDEYRRRMPVAEAKRRLGVPENRMQIGAVGRASAEKGFDLLIRAVGQLVRDGLDLGLWIVGSGEELPRLHAIVGELGLQERVALLGFQADPMPYYLAMELFVLSSVREGLPNVLLEAMALTVPVVATKIAGVPRLLGDGAAGVLVEPGSVESLAEGIRLAVTNDRLRQQLAARARETIEQHYSFQARMNRIADIYNRLLHRAPRMGLASSTIMQAGEPNAS